MGLGISHNIHKNHTMNRKYVPRIAVSTVCDGTTDYLNVNDDDDFSNTEGGGGIEFDIPFSFSLWIKANGVQKYGLFSKANSDGDIEYRCFLLSSKLYIDLATDSNSNIIRVNTSAAHTYNGAWTQYTITFNGDTTSADVTNYAGVNIQKKGISIYINGVQQQVSSSVIGDYEGMNNANTPLTFGHLLSDATYDLNGWMADIMYWQNYELTSSQVKYLYGQGLYSVDPTKSANSGLYSITAASSCKLWLKCTADYAVDEETTGAQDFSGREHHASYAGNATSSTSDAANSPTSTTLPNS